MPNFSPREQEVLDVITKLADKTGGFKKEASSEEYPPQVRERIFSEIWQGPNRLFRVAQLFHKPLKRLNDYYGVARKAIYVDPIPAGEIPAYDKDIQEFASVKIAMKGAPPQVETDIKRVLFPTWDLSITERVRYSDIQIVRYPAFDRAKERCAIANAIAEDTEFFNLLAAAVAVGPNTNLTASTLTRSILADGFGTILRNQLTVGCVILNPWTAKDILKWTSTDLDQVTLYNVTTQGLLGSIWGAKFLVSTKVPTGIVYVCTTPEKLGVMPERKPLEVKVFDNSPALEYLMTSWEHIGMGIQNTYGVVKITIA